MQVQQQQLPHPLATPQQQTHGLSMVCWTTGVVPAPSSPRLLPDDTGLGTAASHQLPSSSGSSGDGGSSIGSSRDGQPVVRGWTQFSAAFGETAGGAAGWRGVESSGSNASFGAVQLCECGKAADQAGGCGQRASGGVQIQQLPCGHE
jgi:hypothetical protein